MSYKTGFYKGRLGIGLTSTMGMGDGNPRYPLDINGDIRLTGAIVNAEGNAINMVTPDSLWQVGVGVISYTYDLSGNPGKVGIGTQNPGAKLQISGTSTNPSTSTQSSTSSQGILRLHGTGGVYMDLGFQSSSPYAGWIQTHNGTTDGVGDDLLLQPVTGNVGIGTTSPGAKLEVRTGTNYDGIFLTNEDGRLLSKIARSSQKTVSYFNLYDGGNPETTKVSLHSAGDSYLMGGNVGIGTTSPDTPLHVRALDNHFRLTTTRSSGSHLNWSPSGGAGSDWDLRYSSDGSSVGDRLWFWYNGDQRFYTNNGTDRMIIKSNGNVGIGTTTPDQKLEINGWISRSAHGVGGFCGSYNNIGGNSKKTNPIYVIGSNYKPNDDTFGNMYGIGFCHSYESGTSDDSKWPKCGPYDAWGLYVCAAGNPRIFMSAGTGPEICLRGEYPTIFFRDTNHRGAAIHVNSGYFYILNGNTSSESTSWSTPSGKSWAYKVDLDTNETSIGGDINLNPDNSQPYDGTGYYGAIKWGPDNVDHYCIKPVKQNETTLNRTANYTKLRINWHTGVQIGGHYAYGGTSFWNDALELSATPDATKIAAIGDDGWTWFGESVWIKSPSNGDCRLLVRDTNSKSDHAVCEFHGRSGGWASYTSAWYYHNNRRHAYQGWAYMYGTAEGNMNNETVGVFTTGLWVHGYSFHSSDRRIKENIEDVPDDKALEMVRNIPCRYYEYKDITKKAYDISNNQIKTIGFIAQEVREHFPLAVKIEKNTIIPNIQEIIENFEWEEFTEIINIMDTSGNEFEERKTKYKLITNEITTDISGIKYKFIVSNDISGNGQEIELMGESDNTFIFDKKWDNIFCYGHTVDDFHILDKDKLFALNFSATQEIDRLQRADKAKIAELENKVATLESELVAIKQHLGI